MLGVSEGTIRSDIKSQNYEQQSEERPQFAADDSQNYEPPAQTRARGTRREPWLSARWRFSTIPQWTMSLTVLRSTPTSAAMWEDIEAAAVLGVDAATVNRDLHVADATPEHGSQAHPSDDDVADATPAPMWEDVEADGGRRGYHPAPISETRFIVAPHVWVPDNAHLDKGVGAQAPGGIATVERGKGPLHPA